MTDIDLPPWIASSRKALPSCSFCRSSRPAPGTATSSVGPSKPIRLPAGVPHRPALPLLYRLEERGWIRHMVEKAGERRRRFSRLSADGRRVLARQRETWESFVEAVRLVTGGEHALTLRAFRRDWGPEFALVQRRAPSPAREAEIVEELSLHLDERWRTFVAAGASPTRRSGWHAPPSPSRKSWLKTSHLSDGSLDRFRAACRKSCALARGL